MDRLAADIAPHAREIGLRAPDILQLVHLVEAADGRKPLTLLAACLDRQHQMALGAEIEGQHRVRQQVAAERDVEIIHAAQIAEVEGPRFPALGRGPVRCIDEVAEVLHLQDAAIDLDPGGLGPFGLPVAVVRGRDSQPWDEHAQKQHGPHRHPRQRVPSQGPERHQDGHQPAQRQPAIAARHRIGAVDPDRAGGPERGQQHHQRNERADQPGRPAGWIGNDHHEAPSMPSGRQPAGAAAGPKGLVPVKGLEPPTHALRMRCSTS
jgi:hypothetical protein